MSMPNSKTFKSQFLQGELTTAKEIDKIVGFYDNTRELIDLINRLKQETIVYKSCIAGFVDHTYGSISGEDVEKLEKYLSRTFDVSAEMAKVMIVSTLETIENKTFDII